MLPYLQSAYIAREVPAGTWNHGNGRCNSMRHLQEGQHAGVQIHVGAARPKAVAADGAQCAWDVRLTLGMLPDRTLSDVAMRPATHQ